MQRSFYKRVKNGKTIELHIHAFNGEYVMIENIFPEPKNEEQYYTFDEFEEIYDIDSFLDLGIESGIFKI